MVHQLYSSISTVGRTHGCVGELLTFTCATSGAWMEWKVAVGILSFRFISSDSVNKVWTNADITAILLEIYDNGTPEERNFTSVIFIKLTNNTLPSNITCSSSKDIVTLNYNIAGKYGQLFCCIIIVTIYNFCLILMVCSSPPPPSSTYTHTH